MIKLFQYIVVVYPHGSTSIKKWMLKQVKGHSTLHIITEPVQDKGMICKGQTTFCGEPLHDGYCRANMMAIKILCIFRSSGPLWV